MTASVGGISTPIIAVIAVGGVFVLLALITITAFICDLPSRMRRRKAAKNGGKQSNTSEEVDAEKGEPTISVTEVDSQTSQITKSSQITRAPSPECQCAHPMPVPRVPAQSPRV
ncbi:hypothetical protein CC86DRAFT_288757 [Ophiobolus disseminans]|uniref:Uncharacterized protein n=1 Tax=Ophiobolus disseminans TaxID=1469910 RepID=A0A6A7A542_9PLEO|nr:hypothetical protein CC86DRAFT_288757 [Ophiobolus disseminans]